MADEANPTPEATPQAPAAAVPAEPKAPEGAPPEENPAGAEALGDAGKKALDAMKAERNAAKAEAKRLADEFAALKAQVEGKQAEFEAEKKARELEQQALSAANLKIAKANLRAAAAGKLADPMDALTFIDASSFEVDDDGNIDDAALTAAIDDLIKSKPYLAAQGKRFQGDADGGARKDAAGVPQLTEADLDRMSPEQIEAARKAGQLNKLLGINP